MVRGQRWERGMREVGGQRLVESEACCQSNVFRFLSSALPGAVDASEPCDRVRQHRIEYWKSWLPS
jgi:hypothetical protein